MPEDEEEVDGGGDGAKREETRKRGTTREKERDRCGREKKMERKREKEGRRWYSRKAVGGGDGSMEQKGYGEFGGRGRTPMEENGSVAAAG